MSTKLVTPYKPWPLLLLAAALSSVSVGAASPTLTAVDVGTPSVPGSMTTAADGKITVVGNGSDIWNNSDNFHYAYFKVTGDFDYVVKVESLKGNAGDGGWSKAELMARLDDGSGAPQGGDPHISNMTTRPASDTPATDPDTGTAGTAGVNYRGPQWRAQRDGASSWTTPNPVITPNMPDNWVRMERVGNVFYMYWSNDGKTWSMYNPYSPQGWDTSGSWPPGTDSADVSVFTEKWPSSILLGLAVTAHADAYSSTAVFSNFGPYTPVPVAITKQPAANVAISANSKLALSVEASGDPVHYEWRKDGTPVGTNGVGPTLNIPLAKTTDSGSYTVRVFGGGKEVISSPSVVAVTVDTTPPTITEVKPLASLTSLQVTFSEPVTAATAAVAANYQLAPSVAVSSAALSEDGFRATLTTAKQALNTLYTLTVSNIKDTAGLSVAADTKATFTSVSLLKGYAFVERWNDANGDLGDLTGFATALEDTASPVRPPDVTLMASQFGAPWGAADNYNARVRTYFTPPSSGNYVFFVSSDDNSTVYLSSDDNPANKKIICHESGWSNQYQWTVPGSGAAEDKRSDLSSYNEYGNPIALVANKAYYMEAIVNEGGGGDGVDVTFIKEGESDPTQDAAGMTMKGDVISWYESADTLPPVIVTQPVETLTVAAGASATLSVTATNPGPAALTYQWKLNGKDIPGATSKDYVIAKASPADIGQYWVTVSNPKASVTSGQNDTPTVVLVTVPSAFAIEAEDFNYDSGKSMPAASVMPYLGDAYNGLSAVFDVDYHNTGATTEADGWTPIYRTGEPITSGTEAEMGTNNDGQWGKTRAGVWDVTVNYKIGWIGTGDWGNYTRVFPEGNYDVFAAQSFDGTSASQLNGSLGFVTAGAGTKDQTVEPIGIFDAPGTGAWSRNNLVRLTDTAGNPKTVALSGEKTLRWTYNSGDADYLLFIPASTTPSNGFTSVKISGGSLVITWTGGSLESADSVTGPWTADPATSPATIALTGSKKFYRLK